MEMVRQLQKSFYQNEEMVQREDDSTTIPDLPLWRVQWTELPGFQNVLNVHVPHYTNMFQKIIRSDANPKYFGHLYLPGGSDNLDNPDYRMQVDAELGSKGMGGASIVGVLMQITDYEEMDDGRLVMIVQALERFKVIDVKRHHSPYAIATVQILPDDELVEAFELDFKDNDEDDDYALRRAIEEAFAVHPYEAKPVKMKDCTMERGQQGQGLAVSPLCNYDANVKLQSSSKSTSNSKRMVVSELEYEHEYYRVFDLEQRVWLGIDEMLKLLQTLVDPRKEQNISIPIPTQILGLLPLQPLRPWPESFSIESYATKLEIEKLLVGTYTQSPFVRVDNMVGYDPLRRAQRLSYLVWTLADTVIALAQDANFTRQDILEIESTEERLETAVAKFELISNVIRELLNNQSGM